MNVKRNKKMNSVIHFMRRNIDILQKKWKGKENLTIKQKQEKKTHTFQNPNQKFTFFRLDNTHTHTHRKQMSNRFIYNYILL